MTTYPVTFDLDRPAKMGRAQLFLRILLLILVSWIAGSGGGLGLVYLGIPVVVAILIAQKGGERYVAEDGERVTSWLTFIVGLLAYVALLTDELPSSSRSVVRLDIVRSGSPTVGTALLRILQAIPSALVLALIGIVGSIVWVVAAVFILLNESYPETLWNFRARCGPLGGSPSRLPRFAC